MTEFAYMLEPRHLGAYQFAVRDRLNGMRPAGLAEAEWVRFLAFAGLGLGGFFLADSVMRGTSGRSLSMPDFLLGLGLGCVAIMCGLWIVYFDRRRRMVRPDGPTLGEHRLRTEPSALVLAGPQYESRYSWSIFEEVSQHKDILALWLEPGLGVVVPRAAFGAGNSESAFLDEIRARISEAKLPRAGSFSAS